MIAPFQSASAGSNGSPASYASAEPGQLAIFGKVLAGQRARSHAVRHGLRDHLKS